MSKLSCGISIPGVTERDGRYYKIIKNKWHPLSRIDEGVTALYKSLYELDPFKPGTIRDMINLYRAFGMGHLAKATIKDYLNILIRLEHHFGHMQKDSLRTNHCAHFLQTRKKAGKGGTRANREMAVLSAVYEYGLREMHVESNPCRGMRRNREEPSKRYVTNEEFLTAFERSNECFQDLIAVSYLTGVRYTDIISWTRAEHITPEGIKFKQSKTKKMQLMKWSDALRFFVRRAMERYPNNDLVFANTEGNQWTYSAVNSQIDRLGVDWCVKQLRAKSQSDAEHSVLGHGPKMEKLYRKIVNTSPVH